MGVFVGKRLISAFITVFVIAIVGFLLTHVVPGDPLTALIGGFPAPPEYIEQVKEEFGLDKSLFEQFVAYLTSLFRGDLGYSFANRQAVLPLILERAGRTLILVIPAIILASVLGVAFGLLGAMNAGTWRDKAVTFLSLIGNSLPVFWLGQLLIVAFAVNLKWFPAQGMNSIGDASLGDLAWHWVLPGLCLATSFMAIVARVGRASIRDTLHAPYVETALAKGVTYGQSVWRHSLPNGMIPVLTVIGYSLGQALTSAIVTEAVFGWPGMGLLFTEAIAARDYPILEGIFIVSAIAIVGMNLLTDLAYGLVDPRIRQ